MKHETLSIKNNNHKKNFEGIGKLISWIISVLVLIAAMCTLNETKTTNEIAKNSLEESRKSIEVAQKSLELSSDPNISFKSLNQEYAWIKPHNEKFKFKIKNNFFGKIKDVYINTEYLLLFPDKNTKHLTICPFGYAKNENNKVFTLDGDTRTNNLDTPKFELEALSEHVFEIDFKKAHSTMTQETYKGANKEEIKIILKITANYKKSINNKSHSHTNFYRVYNKERLIDLEEDPSYVSYNDKKNEIEIDNLGRKIITPAFVYPFKEKKFIQKLNEINPPYDFSLSECKIFTLDREKTLIEY